jgi:hypothetical protein
MAGWSLQKRSLGNVPAAGASDVRAALAEGRVSVFVATTGCQSPEGSRAVPIVDATELEVKVRLSEEFFATVDPLVGEALGLCDA